MMMTCKPDTFSLLQLQLGTELLAGTHSSSCSGHHNSHDDDDDDDVVVEDDDEYDYEDDDEDHLDSPLEESFARLTGENAVVEPRDLVSAHLQKQNISLCL